MSHSDPKYQKKLADFERRVREQPGQLDPAIRRAAADGGELPEPLATYVDTVRRHAYKVTDADVAGLLAAGYTEDQIFEVTVAAAHGVARYQLEAALTAMAASPILETTSPAEASP
jgi:alkylhydroperoxidase family enzyme